VSGCYSKLGVFERSIGHAYSLHIPRCSVWCTDNFINSDLSKQNWKEYPRVMMIKPFEGKLRTAVATLLSCGSLHLQ
jgi:hypothetical protein